jgi:hypothetical protein
MKPLSDVQTMSAVADLKRGLTWEVKQMSEPFSGFWIGLGCQRQSPTAQVLEEKASQLQCGRTELEREELHQRGRREATHHQNHRTCHGQEEAGVEERDKEEATQPEKTRAS